MDVADIAVLISKLFQLHEERAHVYILMEEGYKMYIATRTNYNFTKFQQLISSVTKDFKRISAGISEVENQLRKNGYPNIADLVNLLQKEEETRLQLCIKLQIAKQDVSDNPDITDKINSVDALSEMFNKSIQRVELRIKDIQYKTEEFL